GSWSILIGMIILMIDCIVMKRLPKLGTIFDMVATGVFIDIFLQVLPSFDTLTEQIIVFVLGFFLLAFGCGMYIIGNIGVGPRDMFMLLLVNKVGWSVQKTRTFIEVSVALLGLILGGPLGVGTVFMALALGPIIQWSMKVNKQLFLNITGVNDTMYS
ncbi:MAG: YitT family protein, partial [Lysinibacillus sp.]